MLPSRPGDSCPVPPLSIVPRGGIWLRVGSPGLSCRCWRSCRPEGSALFLDVVAQNRRTSNHSERVTLPGSGWAQYVDVSSEPAQEVFCLRGLDLVIVLQARLLEILKSVARAAGEDHHFRDAGALARAGHQERSYDRTHWHPEEAYRFVRRRGSDGYSLESVDLVHRLSAFAVVLPQPFPW